MSPPPPHPTSKETTDRARHPHPRPRDIRVEDVPDPQIRRPTDAVVRVVAACVCGSDLWPYRGVTETTEPHRIGHEFVGVVEEVGSEVVRRCGPATS